MPTRPILQTTGTELRDYKLEPDRFKTPIMSTSIDETQNPELAWWSDTAWQTEQWLIRFKKSIQLQTSHLSASQWISPLNLSFPVLNDPEEVTDQWTADTLRVAIVTPQATYLKEKGVETYLY